MRHLRLSLLAVLLAACAGPDADAGPQDEAAAESAPQPQAPAPPAAAAPPAKLPAGRSPAAPVERAPTRADSAAAAQQDVSPEWIQRSRDMESYASCMQKAAAVDASVRAPLEAACSRLPDAPR